MEAVRRLLKAELIRFVIVGGISAVLEYSLYFAFKNIADYRIANVMAFVLTNVVTYILTKRYVFTSSTQANRGYEALLFAICLVGALGVNQAVLWALVEFVSMDDKIAKAVAIAVAVVWNFFTRKYIVFRNHGVATQPVSRDFPADKL
jgi:putative flippase GtrA